MSELFDYKSEPQLAAPVEFWKALFVIRNAVLLIRADEYWRHFLANSERGYQLPPIGSFRYSFDIVSDYLNEAEIEGLIDG